LTPLHLCGKKEDFQDSLIIFKKKIMLFSSRAKLLITGEYLVMLGAKALALPLKYSQSITIDKTDGENILHWQAMENGIIWFEAKFNIVDLEIVGTSDNTLALSLRKILQAAREINLQFLNSSYAIEVKTDIDFQRNWGLGTSSTLISNIAWWANIDPFQLHWKVSEGSGYDIACARETSPLIYSVVNKRPFIERVPFLPPFAHDISFVYLGKKQNSAHSIQQIERDPFKYSKEIEAITSITKAFVNIQSTDDAQKLIAEHEKIIGSIVKQIPVGQSLFSDFPGTIKSLGAWGGDFIMVLSEEPFADVQNYFRKKGLGIIFTLKEMI
jgi:mevalonate kinase